MGEDIGLVIAVLLGVAALANLVSGEPLRLGLFAGLVGLVAEFVIIGLARAVNIPASFGGHRFVHVAAIFVLIAVIGWLGHRSLERPGERYRLVLAVIVLAGLSLTWNIGRAMHSDATWRERAERTRAAYTLLTEYGGSPAIPSDQGFRYGPAGRLIPSTPGGLAWIPGPEGFAALVERYGSPLEDPLAPRGDAVPDGTFDELFVETVEGSLVVGPGELPTSVEPVAVETSKDVTTGEVSACLVVEATGQDPQVEVAAPSGASFAAWSTLDGTAEVAISLRGTYESPGPEFELLEGEVTRIDLPDLGDDASLRARFIPPAEGSMVLCMTPGGPA
jgi:hypothetical protein